MIGYLSFYKEPFFSTHSMWKQLLCDKVLPCNHDDYSLYLGLWGWKSVTDEGLLKNYLSYFSS